MNKSVKILQQVKNGYNQIAEHFSNTRHAPWQEFNLFKEYIKNGQKILDAGCGNGRLFFSFLKDYRVEYHGVDNSEKLIEIAQNKSLKSQVSSLKQVSSIKFQVSNIMDLPFEDNQFDLVFCIATFHHLPDKKLRLQALSEMRRVLKPGGYLLMTNWHWQHWPFWRYFFKNLWLKNSLWDFFFPWQSAAGQTQCLRYYHVFSIGELKKLHHRAGFKIINAFSDLEAHDRKIYKRGVNAVTIGKK